ncbi:MAG: CPBP family intramembrane glutamic endopeptidase [Planctomycetota bacterium]
MGQSSISNHQSQITTYWDRSKWPLQSLYFLLPLLVVYEIGALTLLTEQQLTATRLLGQFFALFGVTGVHLPAIAVVGALLGMHIVRKKDPWMPELKLQPVMWGESLVLAMPLFVLMTVLLREPALAASLENVDWGRWRRDMVIAIGAGVYEELLFRMVAIAAIHAITRDLLSLPEEVCVIASVLISSLGFALVHFIGDHNPFTMTKMLFYTVAGVYFAAIYLTRGFGIVVAVHALYDVLVFTKLAMAR